MQIDVFDTFYTLDNEAKMHFRVLANKGTKVGQAEKYALRWISEKGIQKKNPRLDSCRFYQQVSVLPQIHGAITSRGYVIVPLEGC